MEKKKERIIRANEVFCDVAEQKGMEVCSWEAMPGWEGFVNGQTTETDLAEQAKEEMAQLARTFSKYTVVAEKDVSAEKEKEARERKVKAANRIYRKACIDSGRSLCFFKDFTSWQEFVEGRIGDDELYGKAVEEVEKLMAEQRN
ncbi:MAG: hypothetical protein ABFD97_21000 [Syntrophobacter sp.]